MSSHWTRWLRDRLGHWRINLGTGAAALDQSEPEDRRATPRSRRLRTQLLTLTLLVSVPSLGMTIVAGISMDRDMQRMRASHRQRLAMSMADAVDDTFNTAFITLTAIASNIGSTADPAKRDPQAVLPRSLLDLGSEASGASIRVVVPKDGSVILGQPTTASDLQEQALVHVRDLAMRSGSLTVGDVLLTEDRHVPLIPIILPLQRQGATIALLEMQLPTERLTAALRRAASGGAGLGLLIDPKDRVAASSFNVARLTGTTATPDSDAQVATLPHVPGWRVTYRPNPPASWLRLDHPIALSLLGGVVSLLLSFVLISLQSHRITRNLRVLAELARSVISGTDRPPATLQMRVAEFEDLRQGMLRADAVLRRRGAAERMALREARTGHELLMSVVNGTAESIHVKDLELRYVLVNRAGLHCCGMRREEWQVLGRRTAELFPAELAETIEAADRRVLATGRISSFEQEYQPYGEEMTHWIAITITPWQDAEGCMVGVVAVSRDITQQRRADLRLRNLQAELLRTSRLSAMGAMASGLAHELNQPLAAATNYLNASGRLLDRVTEASASDQQTNPNLTLARETVADAAGQMLRAGAIVRRLRDFVDRGEAELQAENIEELLHETCDLLRTDGITDGIDLVIQVDQALSPVLIDRVQIGQVLLNLVRNAAEAILPDQGGGRIEIRARLSRDSLTTGGTAVIEVSDNGPGLSPGIADRLFEPFVSTKRTGMGIGLAICRTIVEGHGGQLTAHDGDLGGMLFRILLPALVSNGERS